MYHVESVPANFNSKCGNIFNVAHDFYLAFVMFNREVVKHISV